MGSPGKIVYEAMDAQGYQLTDEAIDMLEATQFDLKYGSEFVDQEIDYPGFNSAIKWFQDYFKPINDFYYDDDSGAISDNEPDEGDMIDGAWYHITKQDMINYFVGSDLAEHL